MKKAIKILGILLAVIILGLVVAYYAVVWRPGISITEGDKDDPFLQENFSQLRFAHRGGYAYGPENVVPTIRRSLVEAGANAVEVDVEMTKDGQLVLFHDTHIARLLMTDDNKAVIDMTLAELKAIPLRDTTLGIQYVATLQETVDSLRGMILNEGLRFMVELDFKPHGDQTERAVKELLSIVEAQERDLGDNIYDYFFVSSFYPEVLAAINKRTDKVVMGFSVQSDPPYDKFKARIGVWLSHWIAKRYGARMVEPNQCLITPKSVKQCSRRNLLINAYTANTACEKEYLEQFPIAYTTNCPKGTCEVDPSDWVSVKRNWCKACD
jgi:glycerophosphoryl diester phosphodiesterase